MAKWGKGQSGNPGGRAKEFGHVKELAKQFTEMAINTLAEIARDTGAKETARVAASEALLNRAWGRPEQAIELGGKDGEKLIPQLIINVSKE